jgi:hypothetical protein
MVAVHFLYQLLFSGGLASFMIFARERWKGACLRIEQSIKEFQWVLYGLNLLGILTKDLLSMSIVHVCELLLLNAIFVYELVYRDMLLSGRAHHVLAIAGLYLQVHIGIGGALMSYLLIDEVTDYITNPFAYWITFFLVRFGFYNAVCGIAVRQGLRAARHSVAAAWWVRTVVVWWVFAVGYHVRWLWRRRDEARRALFGPSDCESADARVLVSVTSL